MTISKFLKMNHLFQQVEAALLTAAIPYTPEGTDPKAVVHQWANNIALVSVEKDKVKN
jgi:hypothetical protein